MTQYYNAQGMANGFKALSDAFNPSNQLREQYLRNSIQQQGLRQQQIQQNMELQRQKILEQNEKNKALLGRDNVMRNYAKSLATRAYPAMERNIPTVDFPGGIPPVVTNEQGHEVFGPAVPPRALTQQQFQDNIFNVMKMAPMTASPQQLQDAARRVVGDTQMQYARSAQDRRLAAQNQGVNSAYRPDFAATTDEAFGIRKEKTDATYKLGMDRQRAQSEAALERLGITERNKAFFKRLDDDTRKQIAADKLKASKKIVGIPKTQKEFEDVQSRIKSGVDMYLGGGEIAKTLTHEQNTTLYDGYIERIKKGMDPASAIKDTIVSNFERKQGQGFFWKGADRIGTKTPPLPKNVNPMLTSGGVKAPHKIPQGARMMRNPKTGQIIYQSGNRWLNEDGTPYK